MALRFNNLVPPGSVHIFRLISWDRNNTYTGWYVSGTSIIMATSWSPDHIKNV